jgi:ankyrin repeat protein
MSDALLEAIQTRDVDRVAKLLAAGADPNEPGKSRYGGDGVVQPLHAAIWELEAHEAIGPYEAVSAGPIDSVALLLRYGARVNGWNVDKEGDPLLMTVLMKHVEAVRLLLAAGADPNVRDGEGTAPLCFCAQYGLLEMARLLLLCGANKTMHEGGPPAHMNALGYAATRLNVDMVKLLLAHGADPLIEDFDDMTTFRRLQITVEIGRIPDDPASQDRLQEIRQLLGEPSA